MPLGPPYVRAPEVFSVDRLRKEAIVNGMKPATDLTLYEESCTIQLRLEPTQGVVVWEDVTYAGGDMSPGEGFITAIELVGPDSTASYKGPGLEHHFTRQSKVLYVLPYGRK